MRRLARFAHQIHKAAPRVRKVLFDQTLVALVVEGLHRIEAEPLPSMEHVVSSTDRPVCRCKERADAERVGGIVLLQAAMASLGEPLPGWNRLTFILKKN